MSSHNFSPGVMINGPLYFYKLNTPLLQIQIDLPIFALYFRCDYQLKSTGVPADGNL